jgi:uncharacterized protein (TIGR02270 family)
MATAVAPKLTFIPDILEEHFEELAFLWGQRTRALRSPNYTLRELGMLEERIEAHTHGLLAVGERLIPFVEEALAGEEEEPAFAAAYALLRLHTDAAVQRVLDALATAKGKQLDGLRVALCHAPVDRIQRNLQAIFLSAPAPIAAAAAEALAFHSALSPTAERIHEFLRDEAPSVRQGGWRLVSYLGVVATPKAYAAAMRDDDAGVKNAAIAAAAWTGVQAILTLGRQFAAKPSANDLEALRILAILGGPEDLHRFGSIGMTKEMGPSRFDLVASYGHPALVDLLLVEMAGADPKSSALAGAAFARITGQNVESDTRAAVPPEDGKEPDEFEREFQEAVTLPSYERAWHHWQTRKPEFAQCGRLCKGFDVGRGLTAESFATLDMESRWEICLRGRFQGVWPGSPLNLEIFPQSRP